MGDDEVDAVLFPPLTAAPERRPVPDWRYVYRELHRGGHLALRLLWLE